MHGDGGDVDAAPTAAHGDEAGAKALKKEKKDKKAEKALKKAKKAKKELKKAQKQLKKAQKKKNKKAKKSSSSSDSSSSSVDIEFVMGKDYGAGVIADAHHPEARLSKWLGVSTGVLSFVARDDDEEVAKKAKVERQIELGQRDENGKIIQNIKNDWICTHVSASTGEKCEARNWPKNDYCFQCRTPRPRDGGVLARDYGKNAASDHGRGTLNGKVCNTFMKNKGGGR